MSDYGMEVELPQSPQILDAPQFQEEPQIRDEPQILDAPRPRKMAQHTSIDKETIREAYEDVRSDQTDTEWAIFKFDGPQIVCAARGEDFEEFKDQCADGDRAFGYIRIQMGDEMSKRRKFLFLTWIGPEVSVIQRAKMSTDKALMKDVINNFAVELQAENQTDLDLNVFMDALNRAGGANYGTGIRDA